MRIKSLQEERKKEWKLTSDSERKGRNKREIERKEKRMKIQLWSKRKKTNNKRREEKRGHCRKKEKYMKKGRRIRMKTKLWHWKKTRNKKSQRKKEKSWKCHKNKRKRQSFHSEGNNETYIKNEKLIEINKVSRGTDKMADFFFFLKDDVRWKNRMITRKRIYCNR